MVKHRSDFPRGLYGIADGTFRPEVSVLDKVRALVEGGAVCVQLRLKKESPAHVLELARAAAPLCRERGVLFLVNDRVDLAKLAGADGVHLGQDDLPIAEARRLVGEDFWIGATVRTLEEAKRAADEGADHVGFGPMFGTKTKSVGVPPRGLEMLTDVAKNSPLPVVAIGGIDLERIESVARAGAHGAAVVSAALGAPDMRAATQQLAERFRRGQS
jgi:thiamine-phosphate pyrophosphorylase